MTKLSSPATLLDAALEATVVGSFTTIGYDVRSRVWKWAAPTTDLTGQVALVTGATSGLGRATAAGLLDLGATVHVTSRSIERAEQAAAELSESTSGPEAIGHALDTADFDSILRLAEDLEATGGGLDMVIHNAGALTADFRTNEQGTELTLASHLIGPYLLTKTLRPQLRTGARVIFMSSGGMYTQGLDVDEIEMNEDDYRGAVAYAKAKRGQVELVNYLGPQWAPDVILHAVHPGWVDTPGVDAGLPGFGKVMGPLLRTAEQGADTMIWLAATGGGDASAGQFWLDRRTRGTSYLPGTGTTDAERERLVEWLDHQTLPAAIES
jgi:NAD(P)-dependent dehydrogenase (short-subunit alcohol dehydrogenase family)